MSASQRASPMSSLVGPTIEWLEPKVPDILKNGSSSLSSFAPGEGPLEGAALELNSPESCSFSGVKDKLYLNMLNLSNFLFQLNIFFNFPSDLKMFLTCTSPPLC